MKFQQTASNTSFLEQLRTASWDRLGMFLSFICAVHCLVTPLILLSVPMLTRYYLVHPYFHWILAILIVPVGVLSFLHGFKHHGRSIVFVLGLPGLVIIATVPLFTHNLFPNLVPYYFEPAMMTVGSLLLIAAHWINRKACRNCEHNH